MPAILEDEGVPQANSPGGSLALPFQPVTREHIFNCSFHMWHPSYRAITPKARVISLNKPFLDYLRADGIILPSDEDEQTGWSDDGDEDVAAGWRHIHRAIKSMIAELGGKVMPKLNWSAPKDATWMNANTMECHTPNDIYLLLKSSDFVTHDLEHAFDETVTSPSSTLTQESISYHLVLRKAVGQWNPSVEFRCFVRHRRLLCICQRDLNHFDFLSKMSRRLESLIREFFDVRLRDTFPDENFVFDVYVPSPHDRVWLVDINPWAPRTDPLLYSWSEILNMPEPPDDEESANDENLEFVRLSLNDPSSENNMRILTEMREAVAADEEEENSDEELSLTNGHDYSSDSEKDVWLPEFRLVRSTDPENGFNGQRYSAHKLPKDVVDASQNGEGLMEFARDWENILAKRQREEEEIGDD